VAFSCHECTLFRRVCQVYIYPPNMMIPIGRRG
jgi:hypothetical protein